MQYLQRSGQPMNVTNVVTPGPSMPIRKRLIANIGALFSVFVVSMVNVSAKK
jgi:hypothetical protein